MAYLVGKKQDGKTYYYLTESARVRGKPRIVSQRYLGSADEIAARLSEAGRGEPDRSRHLAFGDHPPPGPAAPGDLAAAWSMIGRLGIVGIVDEVVGNRRSEAGASVGTYIALALVNRVWERAPNSASPSGGRPRPGTTWSACRPERSITAGSGTP